jgi:hypothetical protein
MKGPTSHQRPPPPATPYLPYVVQLPIDRPHGPTPPRLIKSGPQAAIMLCLKFDARCGGNLSHGALRAESRRPVEMKLGLRPHLGLAIAMVLAVHDEGGVVREGVSP